jgi:hypothetical protein
MMARTHNSLSTDWQANNDNWNENKEQLTWNTDVFMQTVLDMVS